MAGFSRALKNFLKARAYQIFRIGQILGFDVLPRHFYSQIPDLRSLENDQGWRHPSSMPGVAGIEISGQVAFLRQLFSDPLLDGLQNLGIHRAAVIENGEDGGYGVVEADVLYAFIVSKRPRRIVQVGCGVSTSVVIRACRDGNVDSEIICIEPFPTPFLERLDREGSVSLVRERAQSVDIERFLDLGPGDLLFVDSTHTVSPGSEVNRIMLEVIPRLGCGVFVHFHDIHFPFGYKRDLLSGDLFFWAESVLLQALLAGNAGLSICVSLSMIHYACPHELQALVPQYDPQSNDFGLRVSGGVHFPSSIYLQVLSSPANAAH